MDSLQPSKSMVMNLKDSAHLWTDLRRNFGSNDEFDNKTIVWGKCCYNKIAFAVHSSWYLSSSHRIRAMHNSDGCTHVCAFNLLQCHIKMVHMKGGYNLQELEVVDAVIYITCEDKDCKSDSVNTRTMYPVTIMERMIKSTSPTKKIRQ